MEALWLGFSNQKFVKITIVEKVQDGQKSVINYVYVSQKITHLIFEIFFMPHF